MAKLALIATVKTVPGKRDEYLKRLRSHAARYLATEPGTLKFEMMIPHDQVDTVILYEVYAGREAFDAHWNGSNRALASQDFEALRMSVDIVRCELVE